MDSQHTRSSNRLEKVQRMKDVIIGIDIGGTHLRIGAVDRAGQVSFFEKRESRAVCGESGSGARLVALIRDYLARNGLTNRVAALAVGFPSTISRDKRTVYSSPNLPLGGAGGLDGQDVVALLSGNPCGYKQTSCADQLTRAILAAQRAETRG